MLNYFFAGANCVLTAEVWQAASGVGGAPPGTPASSNVLPFQPPKVRSPAVSLQE